MSKKLKKKKKKPTKKSKFVFLGNKKTKIPTITGYWAYMYPRNYVVNDAYEKEETIESDASSFEDVGLDGFDGGMSESASHKKPVKYKKFQYEGVVFVKEEIDGSVPYSNEWFIANNEILENHLMKKNVNLIEVYIPKQMLRKEAEKLNLLDEFSSVGGGAIIGYTLPIGTKPNYKKFTE